MRYKSLLRLRTLLIVLILLVVLPGLGPASLCVAGSA